MSAQRTCQAESAGGPGGVGGCMKVLVTGGTGFLGRQVVRRLVDVGDRVRVLVRPSSAHHLAKLPTMTGGLAKVDLVTGDLCDLPSLSRALDGMDAVCHCAARVETGGDWSAFEQVTVRGTERLLEAACREKVGRFLHVSSLGVYELNGQATITEDSPFDDSPATRGCYARSKIESEKVVWRYHCAHGVPVTVIRPGVLYGPGRPPFVARILVPFGSLLRLAIVQPEQRVGLAYVENVAEAIHLALHSPQAIGRAYNVVDEPVVHRQYLALLRQMGLNRARTIVLPPQPFLVLLSVLEQVCRLVRRPAPLSRHQFERAFASVRYDTSRAREELGWSPQAGLAEALRTIRDAERQA